MVKDVFLQAEREQETRLADVCYHCIMACDMLRMYNTLYYPLPRDLALMRYMRHTNAVFALNQ